MKQETNIHKMATKGDFVIVEDPTLPEGWTKKVLTIISPKYLSIWLFLGLSAEREAGAEVEPLA